MSGITGSSSQMTQVWKWEPVNDHNGSGTTSSAHTHRHAAGSGPDDSDLDPSAYGQTFGWVLEQIMTQQTGQASA